MDEYFPKTAEEFIELRVFLNNLQNELTSCNPNDITQEQLEKYHELLVNIENGLSLAEFNILDNVNHVNDASIALSKIFGKQVKTNNQD
jgi:hypothetical protein